jgi:hypothetical protein
LSELYDKKIVLKEKILVNEKELVEKTTPRAVDEKINYFKDVGAIDNDNANIPTQNIISDVNNDLKQPQDFSNRSNDILNNNVLS